MGTIRCCLGLHFRLLLLLSTAGISFSRAYPLPPAFAYQPSQHQLAMAAVGLEPIMPVNYPGLSTTSSPSMMSAMNQQQQGTSNSKSNSAASSSAFASPTVVPLSALFAGNRAVDIVSVQQQQLALQQIYAQQQQPQLYIRNSPFQAPLRGFSSAGGGIQQPIFPHGLAMGKTAYGFHPSAAILPSDIPMDVLIGRQVLQNGLDEAGAGYRHPFPFNSAILGTEHQQMPQGQPQPNSLSSSSFGGSFGAEQKPTEQTEPQEFEQSRTERIPPQPTQQQQQLAPASELSAQQSHPPIISAEPTSSPPSSPPDAFSAAASQSEQSSLPVFLRGASQEFIEEFNQIIRQPNSTYAAQVSRIDALVQRMDPERQLLYREFMRENDDRERLHRDRVHKTVAEMSDKAQEQFAKISATLRNPNVADQDRWERVLQLYGKMDTELRNEFEQKFKGFPTIGPATAGT